MLSSTSDAASLTLFILDDASGDLPRDPRRSASVPGLERMAGLGRITRFADTPQPSVAALSRWQLALLEVLSLRASSELFPSAAVSQAAIANAVPPPNECWAHLTCVHLAAGLNDMSGMLLRGEAALSAEDRVEIGSLLEEHLRADGYELRSHEDGWLVRCPRPLAALTMPPAQAFSGSLKAALPAGEDAAELRRLMTEMQMLLHEHVVNRRRARAGLPSANATWLWSVSPLPQAPVRTNLPAAFGGASYLKGLYLLHSQTVQTELPDAIALGEAARTARSILAVIDPIDLASFQTRWLAPLLEMLRGGTFGRLTVYFDLWRFELRRRDLLRFWRRSLPSNRWPA